MKDETILATLFLIALMLVIEVVPVSAWEYFDTGVWTNVQTDNLVDYSGPHADRINITMYADANATHAALEAGQIDLIDQPVNATYFSRWINPPLNSSIAVVDTGSDFGFYMLDMRLDNRTEIAPGIPNPSTVMNTPWGNPMADVWLRRAIAAVVDRPTQVFSYVSDNALPLMGDQLYTPLSYAYGEWGHPELGPMGALRDYTYVLPSGAPNVTMGNRFLDDHGYIYDTVSASRKKNGLVFSIDLYYRTDNTYLDNFSTLVLKPLVTAAPPAGLGLKVTTFGVTSGGAHASIIAAKTGHLYTEYHGWGIDPDLLYYLFHVSNYWHPGQPPNYMYYPGDSDTTVAPTPAWTYNGGGYGGLTDELVTKYGFQALNFADSSKTWNQFDTVWNNPQNYWSWEMMTATTESRALTSAYKCQEFLAYWVCGVPIWASRSYSAFHRTYVGTPMVPDEEGQWEGFPWKGIVNQKGFGTWGKMSFYNMHPSIDLFGDGSHMTIRCGFSEPIQSLNPIYADGSRNWYVLSQAYDSLIGLDPYTLADTANLATGWEVGTWASPDYGVCTKVTFHLRHDLVWSDGMPLTASDVKFTLGGPSATGSISNLLIATGRPPPAWAGQVADIVSIGTPDPWTAIVYMDTYAYFGLHSMSGFNIILPEHIWKLIIQTGDPTQPWNQPNVCSGGFLIDSTADPAVRGYLILRKNPLHREVSQDMYPKDKPINIWTVQTSNSTAQIGNTHWIYPKKGETGVNAHVSVYMHSKYFYEEGPYKENVYPNTVLDGTKTITLWAWNGLSNPSKEANYILYRTIATNVPFEALYCVQEVEEYDIPNIPAWWYYFKVDISISSLTVDGSPMDPTSNPYNGMTYSYKEKMIVTSRYDICGLLYKPVISTPMYQPIVDLKVNVKDTYACGKAFGSKPGYSNWNSEADVNGDFKVDIKDYYAISQNYGWVAPNPLGP